jgi:hypothetical protein
VFVSSPGVYAAVDSQFNSAASGLIHSARKATSSMVEPALRFLNMRMAELTREYEVRNKNPRGAAILEELSELTVIRDELKRIEGNGNIADRPPRGLPPEFPTVETLFYRLNSLAQRIAKTRRDDPQRPELLNELTRLCFVADSLRKRDH